MARTKSFSEFLENARNEDEKNPHGDILTATLHFHNPTDFCFYCGAPLGDDLVHWHGKNENRTEIWLHPSCGVSLAKHLMKDAGF